MFRCLLDGCFRNYIRLICRLFSEHAQNYHAKIFHNLPTNFINMWIFLPTFFPEILDNYASPFFLPFLLLVIVQVFCCDFSWLFFHIFVSIVFQWNLINFEENFHTLVCSSLTRNENLWIMDWKINLKNICCFTLS